MMKINSADGRCTYSVNMGTILYAETAEDGTTIVHFTGHDIQVNTESFNRAVKEATEGAEHLGPHITRLIQAMDRMTIHFPTSVRMHL